ncbi:hypothetical protein F955_01493 [Acinetobacter schindleri CIP 107287]|uniref:Uncharacterized protein n=1 Tax=Acinetobacter schindleri CIP 107287 TaxID=1217988 RepID=N9ALX9_9GAMM|nr:hypothetical protein F955_01493 [Acinetobacter schindleri CIP 107287]
MDAVKKFYKNYNFKVLNNFLYSIQLKIIVR